MNNLLEPKTRKVHSMKNVVGSTVRGENFYPRHKLVNEIYRKLDASTHLFLAAPRRVGKTSIMRYLEDQPRPNYHFVYVTVEAVHDVETFFYKLWDALAMSKVLSDLEKKSKEARDFLISALDRIKGFGIPFIGGSIQLNPSAKSSFQKEFDILLRSLQLEDRKIVFLIDEYPQAVKNIKDKHGSKLALEFLLLCREQRQCANEHILFMYTGSIGLPAVVKSITSSRVINDLNTIEISPFTKVEAKELCQKILKYDEVEYETGVIDYTIAQLDWLIPFHLQLVVQELIDIYEDEKRILVQADVDKAFQRILRVRNNQYFEQYYSRLEMAFPIASTFEQIIILLNKVAVERTISKQDAYELIGPHLEGDDYERVMESLQFDGYLYYSDEGAYFAFTSELIRRWWAKFIVR